MTMVLLTVSGITAALCLFPGGSSAPPQLLSNPTGAGAGLGQDDASGRGLFGMLPNWGFLLLLSATVVTVLVPAAALWVLSGGVLTGTLGWLIECGRSERLRLKNRAVVMRACNTLVGQIEIGELPAQALQILAQDEPMFVPVAGAAQVGGDPVAALRLVGAQPGCSGVTQLACAWELCQRTGMSLAASLTRVTTELIAETELETVRESELASALSTGRLLSGLPLVGLGMGFMVGADPLTFLIRGVAGQLCVLGAAIFASLGLIWTQKLSQSTVTRPSTNKSSPASASTSTVLPVPGHGHDDAAGMAPPSQASGQGTRILAACGGAGIAWVMLGSQLGILSAPVGAVAGWMLIGKTIAAALEKQRDAGREDFAFVLDLLASAVEAGGTMIGAANHVATVVGGACGQVLGGVAALTNVGISPEEAWATLKVHPHWADVSKELARCAHSGTASTKVLRAAAAQERRARASSVAIKVRQVGVNSSLPLVVCYLPAFLLLGVVPIVGGLIGQYM
ncbi:MAG: type II secretion system F family protein [Propionibacteriaceae bacterium]|jgi:tight adherence protein B|nr:type II secretion system F family protein [Propionibacteriaceae bacterium]